MKQLLTAGFQFDQLLSMTKTRGLSALELQLRTVFLGQMAGHTRSRDMVDRTVMATRYTHY